jgi:hypothetical protein
VLEGLRVRGDEGEEPGERGAGRGRVFAAGDPPRPARSSERWRWRWRRRRRRRRRGSADGDVGGAGGEEELVSLTRLLFLLDDGVGDEPLSVAAFGARTTLSIHRFSLRFRVGRRDNHVSISRLLLPVGHLARRGEAVEWRGLFFFC